MPLNLQGYLASACIYSNFERKEEIFINISLLIKVAIKMIKIAPCSNSMYRIQLFHRMWLTEVDDLLCCHIFLKFLHLCHLHKDIVSMFQKLPSLESISYHSAFLKKIVLLNLPCGNEFCSQVQSI